MAKQRQQPNEIQVSLPTLHPDQVKAFLLPGRFKAIRCGRRWGKTQFGKTLSCDYALKQRSLGWFAPEYKYLTEPFDGMVDILSDARRSSSKTGGVIKVIGGGQIDFWTLANVSAGRGRKYHTVLIDEGAFTKPNMMDIWNRAIKPTLLDYGGSAIVMSNAAGIDPENFFWRICNEPEHGFVEYHAPSHANPYLPRAELEKLERENPPLVYAQEYLAEFVDWSGVAFFERDKLLCERAGGTFQPLDRPERVDLVFAVIDTAIKQGLENDGTGVVYFGYSRSSAMPLTILDWDVVQIEGALLEHWLPNVFANCEALAKDCGARIGSAGAFIEDSNAGTILLQHAARKGWQARPITTELVDKGKDGRAIAASPYVYQGKVKFTRHAFDKVTTFKRMSANHLLKQVLAFRVGDKDASKRADDLFDCFVYGISLALGNYKGF